MIVPIWGPPRSGKTTLAIELAYAISAKGKSVLLISPEQYSELSARLNIKIETAKSLCAVKEAKQSIKQLVHPLSELLFVLAVPYDFDAFTELLKSIEARRLLTEANTVFDVVIVDCLSHCENAIAAWAKHLAEKVVMLSGDSTASALWRSAYKRGIAALSHKLLEVCVEVTKDFDYRSLYALYVTSPAVTIPHTGKDKKRYTESLDKLCEKLEVTR